MTEISLWQLYLLGGPVMWPILLSSILAVTIVVEKLLFFNSINEDVTVLKNSIFDAVLKNDIKTALKACDLSGSPTANVLKAGILQYGHGKEEIISAMQQASQFEVPRLEKRMMVLSTIGNVVPLLGLLGTVTGICAAFHVIHLRAAVINPLALNDIAGGVWQSLITTVAGLIVAIPVFIASNYFVIYQNRYVLQMERAAVDLLNFLTHIAEECNTQNKE